MEHGRDEEAEEVLGDIILAGGVSDIFSCLNDNDGLEEPEEVLGDIILAGGDILSYLNDNDGLKE